MSAVWGNPAGRSARSARGLTRNAKAVSGKPEGTSRCGYEMINFIYTVYIHICRFSGSKAVYISYRHVYIHYFKNFIYTGYIHICRFSGSKAISILYRHVYIQDFKNFLYTVYIHIYRFSGFFIYTVYIGVYIYIYKLV